MTPLHAGGFGTPTKEDGRPWLWFIGILGCSCSVLTLLMRLLAKKDLLGIEDILIGVSHVFAVIYWGLFDRALWEGLGATNGDGDIVEASKLFRTSWVMLLCAIYLTKISVLLFERRIFSGAKKQTILLFNCAVGLTAVCGIAAICVSSIACDFGSTFHSSSRGCSGLHARNITILVLEIITELFLVVLPAVLVSKTKMNVDDKVTVVVLFSFRLLCIPFMAMATTRLNDFSSGNPDRAPSRSIVTAAVWTQVVLAWSISSASFPCIKSLLTSFVAVADGIRMLGTSTSGINSNRDNYGNGTSKNVRSSRHRSRIGNTSTIQTAQDRLDVDDASVGSDGSQRIMISRKVDVDITSESANNARPVDENKQNYAWVE